ncbi:MAG TPA: TetR/AcrR family transcriptional regulator [Bacteroidales bacterium]|nr:TetR/AcrR family transcriptional regulator [Bacteroidales bacterium]HRT00387.1 TetR/AcrR family transcriptional regulator [Bacteroidales bacterium]
MELKQHILKEAGMMFSKYGIRSITMDYIASELGVSKRTLYEIFKDKDDLVYQAIIEGTKEHRKMCQNIISESSNIIEAIYRIGKFNHELFAKINPLFFEDLKKYHLTIYNKFHQNGDLKDYELTRTLFEKGKQEGIIRNDINIELLNIIIHKLIDIIHDDDLKVYDNEEILKTVFIPFIIGVSTQKGRVLVEKYFSNNNQK